ncbi:MAG: hypothetical protein KDK70_23350 [Myxococcales bacterium]|nr:hypothetical protein [Myxococcales bacterium]
MSRARAWGPGLLLGLLVGVPLGACFQAPRPAVQFSCDPVDAPECPAGYTCQADGCCHLDGSSVEEHEGECQLGGAVSPTGSSGSPGTQGSSSGSGPGSTDGSDTGSSSAGDSTTSGTSATSSGTGPDPSTG